MGLWLVVVVMMVMDTNDRSTTYDEVRENLSYVHLWNLHRKTYVWNGGERTYDEQIYSKLAKCHRCRQSLLYCCSLCSMFFTWVLWYSQYIRRCLSVCWYICIACSPQQQQQINRQCRLRSMSLKKVFPMSGILWSPLWSLFDCLC